MVSNATYHIKEFFKQMQSMPDQHFKIFLNVKNVYLKT